MASRLRGNDENMRWALHTDRLWIRRQRASLCRAFGGSGQPRKPGTGHPFPTPQHRDRLAPRSVPSSSPICPRAPCCKGRASV